MGCICSKGSTNSDVDIVSADADADAPHHSSRKDQSSAKPLRRLKEEPAVVPHVDSTPPPPPPPDSASDASSMKPQEGDVEKKAAAASAASSAAATKKKKKLESDRGGSSVQHQRRATVHTAAKTDDASSRGGRHGRDGSGNDLAVVGAPNGFSGEHVIAGWPRWLSSVAGEAIKGWLPRRADSFEKLDKIGQGTYSSVYRARDLETGKIVALKKVRFVNMDPESVRFMSREIRILRRLDHPNVIKLEGIVTSRMSGSLYLVFEYMDHDLAGLAARPGVKFTEPQIKCFMQQLLSGLDHCHSRRVLHRDIKGSNLLVDGNGVLRVGDFGLAAVFDPDKKQMLTSRVVTLWYRPPELLLGATEYDVAVDLWSTGCILAELLVGKPIMPGRTEVEQLHKIFKLCGSPPEDYWSRSKLSNATIFKPTHPYPRRVAEVFRDSPPSALALLDTLLAIEPEDRGTAASALQSDFFTTKPLACDPSSLPKFAPSKEYDTKIRDEETRRQREEAKGQGSEIGSRKKRDRKSKPEKETSTETQRQANPKSCSEKYNPQEDSGSGFPIDPPREHDHPRAAGSMMQPGAYAARDADNGTAPHGRCDSAVRASPRLRSQRSCMPQSRRTGDLSNFSGLAAATRSSTSSRCSRLDAAESSEKSQELDRVAASHKKEDRSLGAKDPAMNYGSKNIRIHYSGPLVPPGGNIDDMLKEHERQIQQAVRKARLDKVKTKKDSEDH